MLFRSAKAHQDLERNVQREQEAQERADQKLREEVGPRPETVKTSEGELKLLDVDNPEYRQKREDALKKPGAVVGQVTVR